MSLSGDFYDTDYSRTITPRFIPNPVYTPSLKLRLNQLKVPSSSLEQLLVATRLLHIAVFNNVNHVGSPDRA